MEMMVDIETLDTANTAVVTQVGWVMFNQKVVSPPTTLVMDIQEQIDRGRSINADTLRWWMIKQPRIAREKVFDPTEEPITVSQLAERLRVAQGVHSVGRVWSHGPHFDMAILKDLMGDDVFHYRSPRDTRTLSDLAPAVEKPRPTIPHDAGYDAEAQAKWVQKIRRSIINSGGIVL